MGKRKKRPPEGPGPELVREIGEEIIRRAKETAQQIAERVKKVTEDTRETSKAPTTEHPALKDPQPPAD